MGLSESSLNTIIKPIACIAHVKISDRSPCCKWWCNEPCSCDIDTHEYDSETVDTHHVHSTLIDT